MKVTEILSEMRDRRDAYQRDYDSSVSGFGRGHDHRGLEQELAHETNNYAVSINGKTWKVFGSRQEANRVSNAIERKYPGKEISVHATGAPISEDATPGATTAANVGTVVSPHIAIGKDRNKKSYSGSPGKSGTKAPAVPKAVQAKNSDGTAKNALDLKGTSVFGGALKR